MSRQWERRTIKKHSTGCQLGWVQGGLAVEESAALFISCISSCS